MEHKFKYLEVRQYEGHLTVKRLDLSGKSEREIERIETGLNRNLNHDGYYTEVLESEAELEKI